MATVVTACNSGGNSNPTTYLPAGTYSLALTSPQPLNCPTTGGDITNAITSDGQGNLCVNADGGDCQYINIASNPCLISSGTSSDVTLNSTLSNCQLNSNGELIASMQASVTLPSDSMGCNYTLTLTPTP
ncbi:MAG: hypothetical protein K2Q03_10400 [Sphingobacteriaceae bacterium]|nr:hypothetical protein [Sphingobacteriaceae bacterium]